MAIDQETLAQLLREASEAHHEYEQTLDEKDETWAEWYAEYILGRLDEEESVAEEVEEDIEEEGDEL